MPAGCGFIHGIGAIDTDIIYHLNVVSELSQEGAQCCSQLQATQIVLFIWVQLHEKKPTKLDVAEIVVGGHDCGLALGGQWVMENGGRDLN